MRNNPYRRSALAAVAALVLLGVPSSPAHAQVTTPKEYFGHNIGDDYWLPNYTQLVGYWQKIARQSPRAHLDTIGMTAEGRPQLSMVVSSPENIKNLAHYKEIAKKLSLAEVTEAEAHALAKEGKAVMWIDGGLHASEVLGANQLIQTNYDFLYDAERDEETLRILEGRDHRLRARESGRHGVDRELVQQGARPGKEEHESSPCSAQKYIDGHDDNRDF